MLRWYPMTCDFIKKQTIKDKFYYMRVLMVNVNIEYPSLTGTDSGTYKFNMYYRNKAQKTYNYARSKLYGQAVKQYQYNKSQNYPFNPYELLQTFEPTYCKKPIISLYYDLYEFTGGAHGNTVRQANTWDIRSGSQLSMSDLFEKDYDYKAVILQTIENEARRRQITGRVSYFDELSENLIKFFDEQNYYLTEEGLAVFYPLYTIAPYVAGIQVFIVPYILFGSNLKFQL